MLTVIILSFGFRRNRGKIAQIVIFAAIGDGFEVLSITAVGNADTSDPSSLCHVHCLLLLHNGIVGKLIAGNSAILFHKTDDALRIRRSLGDLIQCVYDEIVFVHITTPFAVVFEVERDNMQVEKQSGQK